jgi:hypothetical protein
MSSMRMTAEQKARWLEALRSGKYKQGVSLLESSDPDTDAKAYCCLGVLQMVLDGDVQRGAGCDGRRRSYPLPTMQWYLDHDIDVVLEDDNDGPDVGISPICSVDKPNCQNYSYAYLNDSSGKTFSEIADLLEEDIEVKA